ncbi:MAG: ATP-dependent DNA helicase RecQ [Chitinophagales bacterium]
MTPAEQILKKYWGFDTFRPLQQEIIESVLDGNDTIALLPTGGGKSVCYQIPALINHGLCIVISPLIALMKDQVEQLRSKEIPSVAIYSGLSKRELDIELDNAAYGKYKFLYVSPERLVTPLFRERLKKMQVNLLAIDEAHCISQWGYDFRPPYLQIAELRAFIAATPVIALTATATSQVMTDIQEKLQLKNPVIFKSSFERKNIRLIVREEEDKFKKLAAILKKMQGAGIVYVRNRRKTKEIADFLQRQNISADFYHAGLPHAERTLKQDNWIKNKCRIIVCTNAFGMGIDKPDVRIVLHWDIPESIEAYYQEAGRGGRDGKVAFAGLIYNRHDIDELIRMHDGQQNTPAFIKQIYHQLGNYFQLAFGAGEGESFPFDVVEFCLKTNTDIKSTLGALKILQQHGYIYLTEPINKMSSVHFIVDHETLYRFQVENKTKESLIKMLLRSCPGVLDEYVAIKETELANAMSMHRQDLIKQLQYLQERKLLDYNPVTGEPQITFVTERLSSDNLKLDNTLLRMLSENKRKRMEAMLQYVVNKTECRTKTILHYFDEPYTRCNHCDICVERNKLNLSDKEFNKVYVWLEKVLGRQAKSPEEVYSMDLPLRREKFLEAVSFMTDNKIMVLTKDNKLLWKG